MAIENDPLYDDWDSAFRRFQDAHDHVRGVVQTGDRGRIEAAKRDLKRAQEEYDKISDKL
ncbi:hypothetical protein KGO5_04264 [Sinorhizobium sp. KGO-5]|nr:hypothetical protein KGO5_04264 [Sinorhizobium sp. KGO-5]